MLITERIDTKKLLERLDEVPLGRIYQASFRAQMRLQLYFTGRTHEILGEFAQRATGAIVRAVGKDGMLDGAKGFGVQSDLLRMWGDTFTNWQAEFQQLRREAAWIPFGVAAVVQERMVRPEVTAFDEIATSALAPLGLLAMTEGIEDGVFSPQIRILIELANEYILGDGMVLSGRIWRLDREAREIINSALMDGIVNQRSAWDVAKRLEQALGANADCPRWTSTRLYKMTASEKTADLTGLISGKDCGSQGVSYNALRLARTELQKIHGLATDRMMKMQPWVTQEQIHLSLQHPEADECDDVITGGAESQGIYPVGTIELPIHPNCFCYKTAVLMDQKEFTSKLRGWMRGEEAWPEMDEYARTIGGAQASILNQATVLAVWLLSDQIGEWLK